jgi:imidazolonepropionase-like amidohydrolase
MEAIRVGRAFDGASAQPTGALVLVDDGRIVGVEPGQAQAPSGCVVSDFPTATVLPGLIDVHVHLNGDSQPGALDRLPEYDAAELARVIGEALERQLAAGVTTVRDLGDRRWASVDWRDRQRAGRDGRRAPTIVASGPPITSRRGHCWSMGGEAEGVAQLRTAVRERVERQVDVIKIMASGGNLTPGTDVLACQFSLDELRLVVEEAHAAGLPVTAHAHALSAVEQAVAAGVDGIEHASCLSESGISAPDALLETMAGRRIAVCPTLGRASGVAPPPQIIALQQRTGATWEKRTALVGRMHRAGVRVVSGVDAGISNAKPHGLIAASIADLVAGDISTTDALASATSIAAEACGLGTRKGRLRVGYDADLLLVAGDPLADVGALSRVVGVMVGGRWVDRSGKHG